MSDTFMLYVDFIRTRYPDILTALSEHMYISGIAVLLGCVVTIPLGIILANSNKEWLISSVFTVANIFQTIPSLALFAMLIPLLGIGTQPAIFALFLYSLMPILRNTYAGFTSVDPSVLESARGMGYNVRQRLMFIQLPLAMPYIMSGIRMTTVYVISWTTLAALIGAGGLGNMIFAGIGVNRQELIFTAAFTAILLAIVVDFILNRLEKVVTKRSNIQKKLV